ncbi:MULTISPECIES: leucine-rich repeat protein [unclassified Treponema]|uniref:leucine-rich repeat protein n=1 Tax=unclassified Treponema TaxID=2638727 RepID=UPI0020A25026|nr:MULTISPECIES: leucine-rich repeat protein [unclassified Treponema]UTC66291.1 leucine-rich repeat protein [Treponema sp. OMZ 789]UTC69021.1 leucine-rich repeat protein [Treponema sp. OMZ 790]UTC71733.1 leucine-rich repeat protein [Treponema sp. OMZ 791]
MKNSNTNKSQKRFTSWAAVLALAASLVIMGLLTACPNAAGGGGTSSGGNTGGGSSDGGSGSVYVQVAYSELETYLANTASADKVNYIEVTGVSKDDLAYKVVGTNTEAGELSKKILAAVPKKVALKLPGEVADLDDMSWCFYGCTNLVSLANIPEGVTNMAGCFKDCTSLTQGPVIPTSVKDMQSCFYGCTSLTKAPAIPGKVTNMTYCFRNCTSLTQAPDIPSSVIGMKNCFYGCTALKGVKLLCNYNGTGNRFKGVFKNCTALEEGGVKVPAAFYNNYTADEALDVMAVPGGTPAEQAAKFATIGGELPIEYVKVAYAELDAYLTNTAFADKVNFIEVTGVSKEDLAGKVVGTNTEAGELGKKIQAHPAKKVALKLPGEVEGLKSMSASFSGCTNLVSLANIPSSVENMLYCFDNCTSLTQAPVIPESVTDMRYCFAGCTRLTEAPAIPAKVTNMAGCFAGCTRLTQAPVIPAKVTNMAYCFYGCTSLTKAPAIPASVTNMGNCFDGCTSLTKAPDIPAKVTNMYYCFSGCTSLTEAPVILASATYMAYCFNGCTSLTEAPDIPSGVTSMRYCFAGCTALKRVKLHCNYNPADIGSEKAFKGLFKNCTALEAGGIKVKNAQLAAYTAPAALDDMAVPGDDEAAKKAKFSTF